MLSQVGYRGKAIVWPGTISQLSDLQLPPSVYILFNDKLYQVAYWYHSVGVYSHAAWCSTTMLAHWPGIIYVMDNAHVWTLACDSEPQPMMRLECSHVMCACLLLLHFALCICSDRIEATKSLKSAVGKGEQNAAGDWTIILIVCLKFVVQLWFNPVVLITECSVSVPNEHLCAGVVAYLGWQWISFLNASSGHSESTSLH